MAAAKAGKVLSISLEYTIFRRLKFIARSKYSLDSTGTTNRLFNGNRVISTGPYLAKDQFDSDGKSGSTDTEKKKENETEKRSDLERLKELLFQNNIQTRAKSDGNIPNEVKQELVKPPSKQRQPTFQAGTSVNVAQLKDLLSSLKPQEDYSSEDSDNPQSSNPQSSNPQSSNPQSIWQSSIEKTADTSEVSLDAMVKMKSTPSVDANKFKDALSALVQDSSTAEEVIMAGRQISTDNMSAMEGSYNMKRRQFQDNNNRKRMSRSSLKTGPQFHMFDKVQEKWSPKHDVVDKSIFQEMTELEVKELGASTTIQSGFHDLIDNVHRQWAFPVNNEICKTVEEGVGFDEHVFLEHHLADFPKTGNISQFMELVVTGLQQNPHLCVQDKVEHIEWFREYFQDMPDEQVQL